MLRSSLASLLAFAVLLCGVPLFVTDAAAQTSGTHPGTSSTIFINEIHYDNTGTDVNEGVEVAGPAGTDLTNWQLVPYNGNGGGTYNPIITLSGTLTNQNGGYGTKFFAISGLQNGAPDGIALVNASGTVVQFLSYEGVFAATNGAANGLTSTDIGVSQSGTEAVGTSLQLQGTGSTYGDFTWSSTSITSTYNAPNTGQTFTGGGTTTPTISVNNPTGTEGNSGTATITFTVSLSQPAPSGGVPFDIATQDNTATVADNDYVARALTGQTITEGTQTYTFDVTVNGDTRVEADETFFVNVTNVTGATPATVSGTGTITNDDAADATITPINQLQGSGLTSPCVDSSSSCSNTDVTTRGTVTLLRTSAGGSGFFIQSLTADEDTDAATSEGIFVFTSTTPTVTVGDAITITGRVTERFQNTTLTPASGGIVVTSQGNTLPAPVTLTPEILNPAGTLTQLERFEGMRLRADSLTTVSPSDQFGDFYTVLTGTPRPFREPGIDISDPLPPGAGANVPRFDENPEKLIVDSNGRLGSTDEVVTSFVTITNPVGVLDFAFSQYRLIPEMTLVRSANISARAVRAASEDEFTVASFNIENFNPGSGFAMQRDKAALAIRNVLRLPDIIGLQEIGDINVLMQLAAKINNDTPEGEENPQYAAFLIESDDDTENDQDVGFLVKTARVTVLSVTQEGRNETFTNPNTGQQDLTNDRPPLVLRANITNNGTSFPVTVITNHLRSLIDVDVEPEGARVRAKRKAQAEYLAELIQGFQQAGENVISVGDYNAYPFNDGFVDVIGTIKGEPAPADQVTLATEDRVDPNLYNTIDSIPADEKYSFIFNGNAQALDQILINTLVRPRFRELQYARLDADFPDTFSTDATRPERVSDHDSPVAYFSLVITEEVTDRVSISGSGLGYSRATRTYNGTVTITNTSGQTINAPVQLVFDNLTAGVTLVNQTGTFEGDPYITASTTSLAPGASIQVAVRFSNPNNVRIGYTPRVYSGNFQEEQVQ